MKTLPAIIIFSLVAISPPISATDAPAQNSSIEKLFSVMGMDQQMKSGFEAMLPLVDQQAAQLKLSPGPKQELRNIYRDWFNHDIDRTVINAKIVKLYAETFSEQEINQLISFYQSPIGRKFLQESPRLTKIGAQIGMEEARAKQHLLNRRLQPFLDVHAK